MSEYELDMSKYTIDEQPRMWTDAEYAEAFQSLVSEYHKLKRERDQYKSGRDTLEAQKTALTRSYKQVVEENKGLRKDNLELYKLLQDFSEFINYKLFISPSSSNYRHYRSELDKLGVK